jgi:hypothetical protein
MGNLQRWKEEFFFSMVKNSKIFWSGLIVMGDLLRWKNAKILQDGLIVMGDLLK